MKDEMTLVMTEYTYSLTYKGEEYEVQTNCNNHVKNIHPARPSTKSKDNWGELWLEIRDYVENKLKEK